ncbi:hypothetical protein C8A00DRAFT_37513 [Chaetomidium leptoderma]|uniref:FHA domain-containing protein n=1 Tax=Chaetomidium leptoderma TaxID=669021 RepID=A0AAN6ZV14_9PEZI|nr:hypothetical protein C8A00DRAFT_37513 [Chaetomidium leptoderma]
MSGTFGTSGSSIEYPAVCHGSIDTDLTAGCLSSVLLPGATLEWTVLSSARCELVKAADWLSVGRNKLSLDIARPVLALLPTLSRRHPS